MRTWLRNTLLLITVLLCFSSKVNATHLYGADFFYTYVSGTTYNVTLVVYGDCSGSAFPSLSTSSPEVKIYDSTSLTQSKNLTIQAPTSGVEVTPVCPSQLSNTNCVSSTGTIPGVKKFVYTGSVTLGHTSAKWKFQFTGNMGSTSAAGRSNSITNIVPPTGGSVMALEATLDNTSVTNSSPTYTTIPTPFFCINRAASYNPGTVDPNSDSLAYSLVAGLESAGGNVIYASGYSATAPLAVASGTFNFSTTTGQLSFTPNLVQRSLVVYRVSEYRNGVLVGTSMREMTFVVFATCSNNPPGGVISSVSGGTLKDSVTVNVCQSAGSVSFHINPTDADGDTINVAWSGIPSGATFTLDSNNTRAPRGSFSWNVSSVTPGAYTFFITYTDNGCPLSSKQTRAYTINVLPNPTIQFNLVSAATCTKKAVFTVTSSVAGPWRIKFLQGASIIDSVNTSATSVTDSLAPGSYTMRTYNSNGCYKDTAVTLASPAPTVISLQKQSPTCNKFSNGSISVSASNSVTPYTYALGTGSYSSTANFLNLPAGGYTIHVKDGTGCVKDTTITLTDSLKVSSAFTITNVLCNGGNTGTITVTGSGGAGSPFSYAINSGSLGSANSFTSLAANTYLLHIEDKLGCYKDSLVSITQPIPISVSHTITDATCNGSSTGSIIEIASGGTSPYTYNINGGAFTPSGIFSALKAGTYTMVIKDQNGCTKTESLTISEPAAIKITSLPVVLPSCYGSADGSITVNASGGVMPYSYSLNSVSYNVSNISGLGAGTYAVRVIDLNGCTKDTTIYLSQPSKVILRYIAVNPICQTLSNGSISASGSGGTSPYKFSFDGGKYDSISLFKPLAAGIHTLSIQDSKGCTVDASVSLKDSLTIRADFTINNTSCFGIADGSFTVEPAGGVSPYKIAIGNGSYRDSIRYRGYSAGNYPIHIKDSIGCIGDTTIRVEQPDKLSLTPEISYNNCYGLDTVGKVKMNVTGGTPPYSYTWSNDTLAHNNIIAGLANGVYKVRVTDAHSCKDSLVSEVTYNDCCLPYIPNAFTPNGDGKNDDFRVLVKGDMKLITFIVYNRFGQCVFTTNEFGKGWDGNFNGSPQDLGTYFYYLKAICGNSGEHTVILKGDVTLIR